MAKLRFLLDTNILSELIRQPDGVIAQRIAEEGEDTICTSIIVACELRYGALKKGAQALSERIEALLGVIEVLALEEDADSHYAAIRCELSRNGQPCPGIESHGRHRQRAGILPRTLVAGGKLVA